MGVTTYNMAFAMGYLDLVPLAPCSKWLLKNINKKADKSSLPNGAFSIGAEKGSSGLTTNFKSSGPSAKVVYPDTSRMVVYDPRQKQVTGPPPNTAVGLPSVSITGTPTHSVPQVNGGTTNPLQEILKLMPPALVEFISHLPAVEGPLPNVDIVLSILLQSNVPTGQTGQVTTSQQLPVGPAGSASDLSGSNKSRPSPIESSFKPSRESQSGKRKNFDRHEDDETGTVQNRPLPRDAFMIRQIRKARGVNSSQTGSASGGSMISGELSGSTG
ncbi:cleavage stimulation factor subunit 77 isoform X1 [Thalictrum thalictroides]|uniref:Cleavage stimulation factor subunit 77 isoform X1 n=1 Tax=Thalictrum thalictroides TaxID=46969 RepID=A0A7J6WIJ2_THATH|nr:cleavage stimulation factor subunit 77 isoform X1 [Thalictrum thalictroides]